MFLHNYLKINKKKESMKNNKASEKNKNESTQTHTYTHTHSSSKYTSKHKIKIIEVKCENL